MYKDVKHFQSLLQTEWKLKVRKQATVLLEERCFKKQENLPDPEDVGGETCKFYNTKKVMTLFMHIFLVTNIQTHMESQHKTSTMLEVS